MIPEFNRNEPKINIKKILDILPHRYPMLLVDKIFHLDLEKNEIVFPDTFNISPEAVKKQVKSFKSVLKLDKNFHIYIHGNKDLIEKGIDENGKKFYKIYYDKED